MIYDFARRPSGNLLLAVAAIVSTGAIAALAVTQLAGTKTGVALAIAAIGGPAMTYLAIVAPLIFPFGVYVFAIPFDNILNLTTFGTLTKLLAIASGLALVFYLVRTRRAVRPPAVLILFGALYFWMALSAFWALDQASVFNLLPTAVSLLVLYVATSVFPAEDRDVSWVTSATVVGGIVAAAYGAFLFHNGLDITKGRLFIVTDRSMIDPNHFAAALLLPTALSMATAFYARKPLVVFAASAAVALFLLSIAESGSRGAVLGFVVMALYVAVRCHRRTRLVLLGIPSALGALLLSTQTSIWSRFAGALSSGGSGRVPIWMVGISALKSHWLFGAGYNNFQFAYDRALLQTHQNAFEQWHRAPHNLLISTSVELGIVGLALMLAIWVAQFRMLQEIAPKDSDYPLRLALEATILGTFVAALFLDVMVFKYVWLTFMLIALARNARYRRIAQHA